MKHTLVGYTGFVGGNLAAEHRFNHLYNSKNITESFGADNGLVVYSGMPAEKFLAASNPAADLAIAQNAFENIQKMKPQRLVLISTVDVYKNPVEVDESTPTDIKNMDAYGANRLQLENWVREAYPNALVVRLPGLFGKGLKKNFIRDMLEPTPGMLTESKYTQLSAHSTAVRDGYEPGRAGYYQLKPLDKEQKRELRLFFARNEFNSLNFTDSRASFQFYNLERLWQDIETCLDAEITLVNMAVEPIEADELYRMLFGRKFKNLLGKDPPHYDMRTQHSQLLGGRAEYLAPANVVADEIMYFAQNWNG